jgi:hypothetical protein
MDARFGEVDLESAPSTSYISTRRNLQSAMDIHLAGRENTEEVYRLLKALEPEVAHLPASPTVESDADKVVGLLWNKAKAGGADWSFIISCVRDKNMFVRAVALDALRTILSTVVTEPGSQVVYRAHQVVQEQLRLETSPLVTYLLDQAAALTQTVLTQARPAAQVQVAQAPANPYVTGQPIRDTRSFFGRESLIRDIRNTYSSAGNKGVVLYGGRRTGKTSLLFQIQNGALGNEFFPVWIDLQAAAGKSDLAPVILRALRRRWRGMSDDASEPGADHDAFDRLERVITSVLQSQPDKSLLLMFDECDQLDGFLSDEAPAARMLSLFENNPRLLALYAGSKALEEIQNPRMLKLLDNCRYLRVSFLSKADTFDLIRRPAQATLAYSDAAADKILHLFGGHPFYTQLLCRSVFAAKNGTGLVEDADVEAVVREFLDSPPPHLLVTWSNLSDDDKLVASALASLESERNGGGVEDIVKSLRKKDYPTLIPTSAIHQRLASLRRADVIQKPDEASPVHVFTMDFVRRWIAHNQTLWDLLEKRSADVIGRSASLKHRMLATLVDWTIAAMLVLVTSGLRVSVGPILLSPVLLLVYYLVLPVVSDRTAGMKVFKLRAIGVAGVPVAWWRALALGALMALEFVILFAGFALTLAGTGPDRPVGVILLALVALQQTRVVVNRHHRGFHEKLTSVVLIRE